MITSDRALGAMLGLAMAESWAKAESPVSAASALPCDGQWADGTAMALALAESLAEMNGVDQRDQMIRYTSWFRYGYLSAAETCTDIDDAVRAAILRFERTWNPVDDENTEGDACLSRIAPVAVFSASSLDEVQLHASRCTQTTHAGAHSVEAGRLLASMVFHALHGRNHDAIRQILMPTDSSPAMNTLRAARDVFLQTTDFAQGCHLCRPHGPRVLATYGQMAGAGLGAEALPSAWKNSLAKADLIERLTSALIAR